MSQGESFHLRDLWVKVRRGLTVAKQALFENGTVAPWVDGQKSYRFQANRAIELILTSPQPRNRP